jgi:hypothetical protein
MKTLAPLTQDGFKASIELLRFQREQNNDLIHAITSIVGTAPTFIKGGDITEAGGNTTITNGIICYNEKLYTFTGGTFAGTPATLKVLFEENTAAGYPQPYFVGDPMPKNIYLSRTARIDATGIFFLSAISKVSNLQNKADRSAFTDISSQIIVKKFASNNPNMQLFESTYICRQYDDNFIVLNVHTTKIFPADILGSDLITSLPTSGITYNIVINAIATLSGNNKTLLPLLFKGSNGNISSVNYIPAQVQSFEYSLMYKI